jgi:hypothetical protein
MKAKNGENEPKAGVPDENQPKMRMTEEPHADGYGWNPMHLSLCAFRGLPVGGDGSWAYP